MYNMSLFMNNSVFWKFNWQNQAGVKDKMPSSPLQPMSKRVSFSNIAEVVLIPSRQEYKTMRHRLWYTDREYRAFLRDMYY